jgi:putative hemolysin
MLASVATTSLLVALVGVCNAAVVALSNARHNRLEHDLSKRMRGVESTLCLMDRLDAVTAGTRVVVALCVVAAALAVSSTLGELVSRYVGDPGVLSHLLVVMTLSFVMVVFGDLLPCQLARRYPETVARLLSPTITALLVVVRPLSFLANRIVGLLLGPVSPEQVSDEDVEEDIRDLVEEGQRAGVIEPGEREIIDRVFKLDDRPLATLMTPRSDVVFLKLQEPLPVMLQTAAASKHTWFPVRGADEDDVVGIISLSDLVDLSARPEASPACVSGRLIAPLEVPLSMSALKLLELFRGNGGRFAIVRDEHGTLSGIVTVYDVLQVIVGEIGEPTSPEYRSIVRRDDGSYLVDASSDVSEVFETLEIADKSPFVGAEFHSLGGFIMTALGHVPKEGDRFEAFGHSFEVIDMDHNRIDKVLVSRVEERQAASGE